MVHKKVLTLIASHINKSEEEIKPEHRLIEDLGLDSLDSMELVMKVEEEFNIRIGDDLVANIKTVKCITDVIGKLSKSE